MLRKALTLGMVFILCCLSLLSKVSMIGIVTCFTYDADDKAPLDVLDCYEYGWRNACERFWLGKLYPTGQALFDGLANYMRFYNEQRLHQSLDYALYT